jgi:hypothetical protein
VKYGGKGHSLYRLQYSRRDDGGDGVRRIVESVNEIKNQGYENYEDNQREYRHDCP